MQLFEIRTNNYVIKTSKKRAYYDKKDGVITYKNSIEANDGCGCIYLIFFFAIFALASTMDFICSIVNKLPLFGIWRDYFEVGFI